MKTIFFVLAISWVVISPAQEKFAFDLYTKMQEINAEWTHHQQACPIEKIHFETDSDAIQKHLLLVCETLLKNAPQNLNNEQMWQRQHLIQILRTYATKKTFPTNHYHQERTPYFVDNFGVHCAVGYLMHQSGYDALVAAIRDRENYSYIEDIQTSGVAEWAEKHGFLVEELKWIQPGYGPSPENIAPVGQGTNGSVNKMISGGSLGVFFAGDFDSLDLLPCKNIGIFQNNQLSCLGTGLDGIINDISISWGKLFVVGQFMYQDSTYTMATFVQNQWTYFNIPTREGALATAGLNSDFNNDHFEVAIDHPTEENTQEIWTKSGTSDWQKQVSINGKVTKIGVSNLANQARKVFVGGFKEAVLHNHWFSPDTIIQTNNVLFWTNSADWTGIQTNFISDTVNTFLDVNGQLYFAGSATGSEHSYGVLLSRYLNDVFQPIITTDNFLFPDSTATINAISFSFTHQTLYLGGSFFGHTFSSYNANSNQLQAIAVLNAPVQSAVFHSSSVFFGGDFTMNLYVNRVNHLGRTNHPVGLDENHSEAAILIFPNPFTESISIQGLTEPSAYKILDLNGRIISDGLCENNAKIELGDIKPGAYFVQLETPQGRLSRKLIKQ